MSNNGLARFFGAPQPKTTAASNASLFDDENFADFNSTPTTGSSTPSKSTTKPSTTTSTPSKPAPASSTKPTTSTTTSTPTSQPKPTASPAPITSPPQSATKHTRPVVDTDSDDDEVIIKKAPSSTTTPSKPSSTKAPVISPAKPIKSKYKQSSSEEDEESDDDGSSDDFDSDDDDDDGSSGDESSFCSESEDEKPKRGHKAVKATSKGKKAATPASKTSSKLSSKAVVSSSDNEGESNDEGDRKDNEDGDDTMVNRVTPQFNADGGLAFSSFVNTGAPRPNLSSTSTMQSMTPSKTSKTPLLSNNATAITNFFQQQQDDEDDNDSKSSSKQSASSSSSSSSSSTTTTPSTTLDYKLPSFVHPDKIKDKQGRRPDHPDYDPRTLYLPPAEMKDFSPAQKQFWEMKAQNMDVVLLFKVGKFYELFDLDAEVGVKELGLLRMGTGDRLHVGFPEAGYAKYATILVKRGYKVACGEQVQTPDQMKEENSKLAKGQPKRTVVKREICSFVTPGTGVTDDFLMTAFNTYLLALMEFPLHKSQAQVVNETGDVTFNRVDYRDKDVIYGVCFVDTSTGSFQIGSFIDNTNKSSLKALLAQVNPAELLFFKDSFSIATETILRSELPPTCIRSPVPKNEKIDSTRCISQIAGLGYFKPPSVNQSRQQRHNDDGDDENVSKVSPELKNKLKINLADISPTTGWPNILQTYRDNVTKLDHEGDDLDEAEFQQRFQLNECFWGAFGLVWMYLKRALLDKELIPLCKFKQYTPIEAITKPLLSNEELIAQHQQLEAFEKQHHLQQQQDATELMSTSSQTTTTASTTSTAPKRSEIPLPKVSYDSDAENLVLDSQTLANLEILINAEGNISGTLLHYIDHCSTAFGKRLLHKWLIRPLFHASAINARLDAVTELIDHYDLVQNMAKQLSKVPDLERMLSRIRANGIKKDIEAVMYGDIGKVQVELFLKCLEGFEVALTAVNDFLSNSSQHTWSSQLLQDLSFVHQPDASLDDENPNIFKLVQLLLVEFRDSFDQQQAKKDGHITPRPGVVEDFDDAQTALKRAEKALDQELQSQRAKFGGSSSIVWCHKNKETYQLEVPVELISRYPSVINKNYDQISSTTKVKRFYTNEIRQLAKTCDDAKARKEEVLKDVTRQVFEKFSLDYSVWAGVVDSLASLDCLLSLATASYMQHSGVRTVRPTVLEVDQTPSKKPMLELRNAIHPTVAKNATFAQYTGAPQSYIPNDTDLGSPTNPSRFILVSGPNMGGKSTLLRQVCCCIILAQIGCYVPAEGMRLTPIDRIFTRVGANDRIMQGQSTFLVELEETSHILRHATPRSFVILDELGRGTSTFDGTAIAYSVIQYLSQIVQCMTLFSTHYHMLLQEYRNNPLISMYHMACKVHNDNDQASGTSDHNQHIQRITFLYKFVPGTCNKSFGLHVAALAKLPALVIDRAYEKGEWFSICFEQPDNEPTKLLKRVIIALHHNDFYSLKKLRQRFVELKQQ